MIRDPSLAPILKGEDRGTPNFASDIWNLGRKYNRHRTDKNYYDLSLIGATIWEIWLERKNRIFNNKFASALLNTWLLYRQDMSIHNRSPQQKQLLDTRRRLELREIVKEEEDEL